MTEVLEVEGVKSEGDRFFVKFNNGSMIDLERTDLSSADTQRFFDELISNRVSVPDAGSILLMLYLGVINCSPEKLYRKTS